MKLFINDKAKKRIFSHKHPWVFKSDIQKIEASQAGVVEVFDPKNQFCGMALYSPLSQISLRMLCFQARKINEDYWREKLLKAKDLREKLPLHSNAYRIVFGESDEIPSFILDRYHNSYVFQSLSAGIESQKEILISLILDIFKPEALIERSDASVRQLEGLPLKSELLFGNSVYTQVFDQGFQYEVNLLEGQKTGAFLDQRANRLTLKNFANGCQKALDCFSYHGWFALPLSQKAAEVLCIDQSEEATKQILKNAQLNNIQNIFVKNENVFDYLKNAQEKKEKFDLINLDPPAFVKNKSQLRNALKGYKEINLRAMKLLNSGGILMTSSCSHHLSTELFLNVLQEAARDAKKQFQILTQGVQDADHPALLGFPESFYLKCFVLRML